MAIAKISLVEKFLNIAKNVAKAGLVMLAVGAALAIAAPAIGVAVGIAPSYAAAAVVLGNTANPLWLGAFFGSFGALRAAIAPVADKIFAAPDPSAANKKTGSPATVVMQAQDQELAVSPLLDQKKFTQMIEAEKARSVNLSR